MSEPITFELPYPPRELSPNGRSYFIKKNNITQQYKLIAKMSARNAKPRDHVPWKQAISQVTFYRKQRGRKMDADNCLAQMKSAFDGMVLAGVIVDDCGLSHKPVLFEIDKANPRVVITITPI